MSVIFTCLFHRTRGVKWDEQDHTWGLVPLVMMLFLYKSSIIVLSLHKLT